MEVSESLLFRHDINMVASRILHQFFHLGGGKGAFAGSDQGFGLILEWVFQVHRPHVELVLRGRTDLAFHELQRGDRAAADVVMNSPIT